MDVANAYKMSYDKTINWIVTTAVGKTKQLAHDFFVVPRKILWRLFGFYFWHERWLDGASE